VQNESSPTGHGILAAEYEQAICEAYARIRKFRAERDRSFSSMKRWVELSDRIDEETGRIARLRWEMSRRDAVAATTQDVF
jgi:L-ribulose-5-phosphate 3-epimerase UlaE